MQTPSDHIHTAPSFWILVLETFARSLFRPRHTQAGVRSHTHVCIVTDITAANFAMLSGRASYFFPAFSRNLRRIWRVVHEFQLRVSMALVASEWNAADGASRLHQLPLPLALYTYRHSHSPIHTCSSRTAFLAQRQLTIGGRHKRTSPIETFVLVYSPMPSFRIQPGLEQPGAAGPPGGTRAP